MDRKQDLTIQKDILETNTTFYDTFADHFEKIPFKEILPGMFTRYSRENPGKKVLEIGSGPGVFGRWVQDQGYAVMCLDPSKEMCSRCKAKGLDVVNTSFEEFHSDEAFDHIFAISSLIHVPKHLIPGNLEKIKNLLAENGVLYINFMLGSDSGLADPTSAGRMRYFCRYGKEEVLSVIDPFFTVIEEQEVEVKRMSSEFLLLILKKKQTS